jgi:flavodoxin
MKIGIIVHSQTGNTLSVAEKLQDKLISEGHSVNIQRVTAVDDGQMEASKVQLRGIPEISSYDVLIFGAPVRGFSLSAVMSAYLSQTRSLKEKKIFCYTTQFFPFPAMGGNRAMEQMKNICQSKGANIDGTGIVNWSNLRREKMIKEIIDEISGLLSYQG